VPVESLHAVIVERRDETSGAVFYHAFCPRGHELGPVRPRIEHVFCKACQMRYETLLSTRDADGR